MRESLPSALGRPRTRLFALAALVASVIAVLAVHSPAAHAAFDSTSGASCFSGANNSAVSIQGEGSSLQNVAHANFWIPAIFDGTLAGCGSNAPAVTFKSASSGCGLDAVGAGDAASGCTFSSNVAGYRDGTDRFGASDFPPNSVEKNHIQNGPSGQAGGTNSGVIHVLPVAEAAIAVVVNQPAGCELQDPTQSGGNANTTTGGPNDSPAGATKDAASNGTLRVHITAQTLEGIWEHAPGYTTWGAIVPAQDWAGSNGAACASTPIYRIVRQDTSGTSYNYKAYLSLLPSPASDGGPALWTSSTSQVGSNNLAWPRTNAQDQGVPAAVGANNQCTDPSQICHALSSGGGGLAKAVTATSGSIGYLDLATARANGFDITPLGGPSNNTTNDHTYWVPLQPVDPSSGNVSTKFAEPTQDATAHTNPLTGNQAKGANCSGAAVRGVPTTPSDVTLGDWSGAIATGGSTYPACALTYILAFDDDAPVYGNTPTEEQKARGVKDYLTAVESSTAQGGLIAYDYAPLTSALLQDAQNGVAAIGWNKAADSSNTGGGGGGTTTTPAPTTTTTSSTPTTTQLPPVSNAFSILSAKVVKGKIVLSLSLPGPGTVTIDVTTIYKGKTITVRSLNANVNGGTGTVTLTPSPQAASILAKQKRLSVNIGVIYLPNGGTASNRAKSLTLVAATTAKKHKAKKKTKKKATKKKK